MALVRVEPPQATDVWVSLEARGQEAMIQARLDTHKTARPGTDDAYTLGTGARV